MSRLTSEEHRRIFFLQEQAGQRMLAPLLVSTAAIDRGRARCGRLQGLTRAVFSLAFATAGLLLYAFVEFHAPASLVDAFLPRW